MREETYRSCSIAGCERPVEIPSRGWCRMHYQRWWRDGTTDYPPLELADPRGVDPGFAHWLAGFIDGEGCFYIIQPGPGRYAARFTLKLRDDDAAILEEIVTRTHLGYVRRGPSRLVEGRNNRPQALWHVSSKADCVGLVELLDHYPLRAKKSRDYAIWREAVLVWTDPQPLVRGRYDWTVLGALFTELKACRVYA